MTSANMLFKFKEKSSFEEAEGTLRLARLAVESLFGLERTNLEANVTVDRHRRRFAIDVSQRVGRTLALVFAGYARREFDADDMHVEHDQLVSPLAGELV